ncbi:MAG: DUF1697 domain-containing protein [Actinomycetota bacterium]
MRRFIAFLGGINVGGHRVTMARVRDELSGLGFADVSTFIASGNVFFRATGKAETLESRIEAHLAERLGWPVPTFVRTAVEIAAASALQPFGPIRDGFTHMVVFCRNTPDRAVEACSTERDRFLVHGNEVHWLIEGGVSTSGITLPRLARLVGPNTTRHATTVAKLAAMSGDPPSDQ